MDREQLGRIAYTAYVDYIGEGEEMDTWDQLPESDRKIYRYIGEAVVKAHQEWDEELLKEQERVIHKPIKAIMGKLIIMDEPPPFEE